MNKTMDTVIVDWDPRGREMLYKELNKIPSVNVVGEAINAQDAYRLIKKLSPDVVFIDVNHPLRNGFELLDKFEEPPFQTVVYSNVSDFALKAIKYNATDYLLKPLETPDVLKCVDKIQNNLFNRHESALSMRKLDVFAKNAHNFIRHSRINYVKAMGAYSCIALDDGRQMIISKNLKTVMQELGEEYFYRVHNSYLINLIKVTECHFKRHECKLQDGSRIKISVRRSDGLKTNLRRIWSYKPLNP